MLNIMGICGSLRRESLNRKLLNEAVRLLGPCNFASGDLNLPLYNGDDEDAHGMPESVLKLADQISTADAVIITCPEYNQALTGVMKNALDWISRTKSKPWQDKPVVLMSAAAGRSGGARAQYSLRLCLTPFRPVILNGPEVLIAQAGKEFDDAGRLGNPRYLSAVEENMQLLRAVATTR